jgi:hypothetical protein
MSETRMKWMGGKKTHQSVAIVTVYVYYAFRQMFAQAKKESLNNLSLLVLFLLPMFTLSLRISLVHIQMMSEGANFEYSTRR